jgi:SAM-dependent methyltransferase
MSWWEKAILKLKFGGIAKCPVCGSLTWITDVGRSLRESCKCMRCKSTNRQRQIGYVVCNVVAAMTGRKVSSLRDVARLSDFVLYNTEAGRAIHDQLTAMKGYVCSEYFGDQYQSGDVIDGKVHQNLMNLSFNDESIDLVVSSDVFEHIPDPYKAHKEVRRVLKNKGRHIFTVPFYQTEFLDEDRTVIDFKGNKVFLKEALYHGDPMRSSGALVYKIFSLEMLAKLRKVGFRTNLYRIYNPWHGIYGSNAIVFEAIKV